MVQTPKAPEYYFNVLQSLKDKGFAVRPELDGFSLAGGDYGKSIRRCATTILETLDEIKKIGEDIGLKLPRGKIIEIRSTLGEGSSELRGPYQPLSPKKLGKLVGELNKQRNVFIEGEVGQFLSSMGKERR